MSDPLMVPSLASLPTQLLGGAPAWYWRYASVATISFVLACGGDYYMGSPVTGWIRAWAGQKAKAVELRPLGVLSDTTEKRIADLEAQSLQFLIDAHTYSENIKEINGKLKALEAVGAYTIGRVGTLESYMSDKPAKAPAKPGKAVLPVLPVLPLDTGPIAKIGGTP